MVVLSLEEVTSLSQTVPTAQKMLIMVDGGGEKKRNFIRQKKKNNPPFSSMSLKDRSVLFLTKEKNYKIKTIIHN